MRNIHELEQQWIRYKLRTYAPWMIAPLLIIVLFIFITYFLIPSKTEPLATLQLSSTPTHNETIISSSSVSSSSSSVPQEFTTSSLQPQATVATFASPVLTPSLNFIERLNQKQEQTSSSRGNPTIQAKSPQVDSLIDAAPEYTQDVYTETIKPTVALPPPTFSIGSNQDAGDIQEVVARFKLNKKPALSLFIAKRYYAIRQFRDAYNYALITNELDPENEESWLIAAKSLVKLREKEKALHLLKEFIARSDSVRAKMVLAQIENGTLE